MPHDNFFINNANAGRVNYYPLQKEMKGGKVVKVHGFYFREKPNGSPHPAPATPKKEVHISYKPVRRDQFGRRDNRLRGNGVGHADRRNPELLLVG